MFRHIAVLASLELIKAGDEPVEQHADCSKLLFTSDAESTLWIIRH